MLLRWGKLGSGWDRRRDALGCRDVRTVVACKAACWCVVIIGSVQASRDLFILNPQRVRLLWLVFVQCM